MRLIDADKIVEVAEHAYGEWDKAMAAAEKRQINRCFKMQELCKAVKGVADDCHTIDPESLRPTAHWISVKDRLPAKHERVLIYDSVCHNIYMAWRDDDLDVWFSEEYLPDFVYVTHWMPLPEPLEVTP